jgi:hypothetical protein
MYTSSYAFQQSCQHNTALCYMSYGIRFCITQKENDTKSAKRNKLVCGSDALDCLQFTTIFTTVQQKYVIIRCPEKPNHRRLNGLQSNESLRSLINAYLTGPRNNLRNVQYNSFVHKCTKKSVCKTQDTPTLYFQTISRKWQLI